MATTAPQLDFAAAEERARTMTEAQLVYNIADCRQAIEAMPDGYKAGYYQDELYVFSAELRRRAAGEAEVTERARLQEVGASLQARAKELERELAEVYRQQHEVQWALTHLS